MKSFEQQLIEKYPDLFPKDKDGNPTSPDCGVYCPAGWQIIVETLCTCIDSHVKHPNSVQIKKWRYAIKNFFYRKIVDKICYKLCKIFDPYKTNTKGWMTQEEKKKLDEEFEFEVRVCRKIREIQRFLRPNWEFKKVYPRNVTIDQVKEKFGGLRFYYSGGDKDVAGMVYFAECLSYKTCQNCGKEGKCDNQGWWRTLCNDCKKPKQ